MRPPRKRKMDWEPMAGAAAAAAAAAARMAAHRATLADAVAEVLDDDLIEVAAPSAAASTALTVEDPLEEVNLQAIDCALGNGDGLTGEEDFELIFLNFPYYGVGEGDDDVPVPAALVQSGTGTALKCTLADLLWKEPMLFGMVDT